MECFTEHQLDRVFVFSVWRVHLHRKDCVFYKPGWPQCSDTCSVVDKIVDSCPVKGKVQKKPLSAISVVDFDKEDTTSSS